MFVFKAAVVGAGVMGGEIAQVIAAADIPVILKDVDQRFVDTGLEKAREVTANQAAKLVNKGKITQEQGDAQVKRILGNITGATAYDGFGDVDFVIEAVPEKMEIKHAGVRRSRRGHARPRDPRLQHVGALDHRDRRRHAAAGQGRRLPLLLARVVHAPDRGDRGRRDVARDRPGRERRFAQQIRKMPIRAAECPGFVVNRILVSTASEIWRYQDETGVPVEEIDEFIKEKAQMPMGPFRVADMSGLDTVVKVARDMREAYGDRFYVHKGMEERLERGELGAKTGKGFYEHR